MASSNRPTPPPGLKALATALQSMRKRKGLTQADLAARTGNAQGHISGIESGTFDPRASTLLTLASALGCELVLVPKEHVGEALRSAGLTPTRPKTVFDEVYVPDPGAEDTDED